MAAYDLAALWEAHCRYEFETRDVDATMSTMVAEPYVNHIPTMTGGVGFESLRHFYAHHFIGVNPPDFDLLPVSRTVGESSLVDEFIVRFKLSTTNKESGEKASMDETALYRVKDGKITEERFFYAM